MSTRVQVIFQETEKTELEHEAKLAKVSLSSWLRRAAMEKLTASKKSKSFSRASDLQSFFEKQTKREKGEEPDWNQHLDVIAQSVTKGRTNT